MKTRLFAGIFTVLLCSVNLWGQESGKKIKVSGTVRDNSENPIPGAAIFVDEVNTNKVTNRAGSYKIKVTPEARVISVFSPIFGTTDAELDGKTTVDFILGEDSSIDQGTPESYSDETVSDGYGSVKKKDLTTSVTSIDARQNKYRSYQSIYDMIRGEVPGVRVIGTKIQIMGPSSFNASEDPLFVVDGIPVDDIKDIIPSQVKSIEILKGAAAGIYGTRASNGVIVIKLISADDVR